MTDTANGAPTTLLEKQEIAALFEGVGAPADKVESFVEIFESAVSAQVQTIAEAKAKELEEKNEAHVTFLNEKAEEYVQLIKEEQEAKIDAYTKHFAEEFIAENKPTIESNVKASLFESLIGDVLKLVENYNIEISDEKADLNKTLEEKVAQLEAALLESQNKVVALTAEINEGKKATAISEAVADLAESQAEKVRELVEEITYNDAFAEKLQKIVEAIAKPATPAATPKADDLVENLDTPAPKEPVVDSLMASYLTAAKSTGKFLQ